MDINYSKKNNKQLFEDLEKMNLYNLQNYIPSFKLFFKMNESNNDSINLDITEKVLSIEKQINYNICEAFVSTINHTKRKKQIFLKYAPLVDPIRFMAGKYKNINLSLPKYNGNTNTDEHYLNKIHNEYNSSYVDGIFSYLSSMLHKQGFLNALNFHGIFIGYQRHLKCNIIDDLEFLTESSYFHNNLNTLFNIDKEDIFSICSHDTGGNKERVKIMETYKNNLCDEVLSCNAISNLTESKLEEVTNYDNITEFIHINMDDDSSTCSSASSITDVDENEGENQILNEDSEETESYEDDENSSTDCSEISYIESIVNDFPVTVICMEKCENTLDYLMENELINTNEWISCLMQVIMTLIVYQNIYNFTHNDLHSSNIMYIETKRKYLYYKVDDKVYKVPTYGRIFKIIDFGRSIYHYKNILLYSDAFDKKEDAATQYNFGPFRDEEKPEILPNKSFDLSRLACSLYDYFDDYEKKNTKDNDLALLIKKWCTDDNGKNILYKSSGEERYPEFKLYKMISRTVHNCVPIEQLRNTLFSNYITVNYEDSSVMDVSSYIM